MCGAVSPGGEGVKPSFKMAAAIPVLCSVKHFYRALFITIVFLFHGLLLWRSHPIHLQVAECDLSLKERSSVLLAKQQERANSSKTKLLASPYVIFMHLLSLLSNFQQGWLPFFL